MWLGRVEEVKSPMYRVLRSKEIILRLVADFLGPNGLVEKRETRDWSLIGIGRLVIDKISLYPILRKYMYIGRCDFYYYLFETS